MTSGIFEDKSMEPFGLGQIGQVAICVKDADRAMKFYRDVLGMKFLFQFPGMAFFDCGRVRLYLTAASEPKFDHTSILYYRVPSIMDAAATLEARGVSFVETPHMVHQDARHELWLALFQDSEGNHLALMSEVMKS